MLTQQLMTNYTISPNIQIITYKHRYIYIYMYIHIRIHACTDMKIANKIRKHMTKTMEYNAVS